MVILTNFSFEIIIASCPQISPPSAFIMNHIRAFSTTANLCRTFAHVVNRHVKKVPELKVGDPVSRLLKRKVPEIPPYPYGESHIYKQSNRGLYGGKFISTGHQISEFKNKHLRYIKPNVQRHKLWSESLNRRIRVRVVNSVLKTITKEGGLDNYLIKDKSARIKELGPYGWRLRYEVLKKMEENEKKLDEAKSLEGVQSAEAVEDRRVE